MNIPNISKRILAMLLACLLVFSVLPVQALAMEGEVSEPPVTEAAAPDLAPQEDTAISAETLSPEEDQAAEPEVPEDAHIAVTGIVLGQETLSVPLGGYSTLSYTIFPEDAANQAVIWSSDNEAVATVVDGQVNGLAVGTALITATTADGGFCASVTAEVADIISPFSGSRAAVTEITSAEQLAVLDLTVSGSYRLMNDISLPENWAPVTMGNAEGTAAVTFDGNGKTVILNGTALFDGVYNPCVVKNLKVTGTAAGNSGYNFGPIAISLSGTIQNCIVDADVTNNYSWSNAGGIVGALYAPAVVKDSAYLGKTVTGAYGAGAIASGGNSGTAISNCWWLVDMDKADGNGGYGATVTGGGKAESTTAAIEAINTANASDSTLTQWTVEGSGSTEPAAPAVISLTVYNTGEFARANDDSLMFQKEVTITDTNSDGQLSLDEALAAAHAAYNSADGYATVWSDTYQSSSVTKFWGVETGAVGFYRNDVATGAVDQTVLSEEDQITAFIYADQMGWSDRYSYFSAKTAQAAAGEEISLKLNCWGYDANWNPVVGPAANVALGIFNMTNGAFASLNVTTDENGEAEIIFSDPGTYYVTAQAAAEDAPLVPPVCVVTVSEAEEPRLESIQFKGAWAILSDTWSDSDFDPDTLNYSLRRDASASSIKMYLTYDDSKYDAVVGYTKNYYGAVTEGYTEAWDNDDAFGGTLYLMSEDTVVTITVTDKNDAANSTVYTLNIGYGEESETEYEDDNTLYTSSPIAVSYGTSWPYSYATVYQADANGVKQSSTDVTNAHKTYYAELPDGTTNFYFSASPNGANAKVRYRINEGEWRDNGNALTTPAKVEFQIISEKEYYAGTEGWENKTTNNFTVWVNTIVTSPFDGEGTEESPYLLTSAADFDKLDELVEGGETFSSKYFKLTANVTLSSGWDGIGYSEIEMKTSWGSTVPTATVLNPFAGSFDGDGHTLTFPNGSKPLFDCVRTAAIKDLKIQGAYIADDGLIANYIEDKPHPEFTANISNVTILSGTKIAGSGFLGGYASANHPVTITNCHIQSGVVIGCNASGNSLNASNIGGFAGDFNGTITESTCAATVYGKDFVGGILGGQGQSKSSEITHCTFSGTVIATGNYVGGISGSGYTGTGFGISSAPNTGTITITDCTVTGDVTGSNYVGGILGAEPGVVQCWENGKSSISDNTFTGTLTGSGQYAGGIIGYLNSLNKYQTISGNEYMNAEKGIGGVLYVDTSCANPTAVDGTTYVNSETEKTGISGMSRTGHNRTDDPLGADTEDLARFIGNTTDPTPPAPTVTKLEISGSFKNRYDQGEVLDLTGAVFTATWSDGTTTNPEWPEEVKVTGYNAQSSGTQYLVASYGGKTCTITVNVVAATTTTNINVTFSMLGDTAHGDNGTVHTLKKGGLTTWISTTTYSMNAGSTVLDLLAKACRNNGISYSYSGNFVNSVTKNGVTLASFTNGANSGWMYTLNGVHSDYGVSEQKLSNGDSVVFHYTDDYKVEEGSEDSSGGTGTTEKTAAEKVIDLITAIGTVSYTDTCKAKINAARAAYNALSATEKAKVTNITTLEAAETSYANLKKLDDQKQADAVDALINKVDKTITLDSEPEITAAKAAYDQLTEDQKALVTKYDILKAAENQLASLKATDTDKEQAQAVMNLIEQIGAVTLDSEEKIKAARTAYDKLTDLQKALVTNIDVLEAAETALARLKELTDFQDAYKTTGEFLFGQELPIGSDWIVLGLIRSGYEVEEDYGKLLLAYIRENADEDMRLHRAKSSDNSRTILALTAMGYDATDVEGYNLVAGLDSMEYISKQGINGAFWALIALDSANYPAPGGDVNRENLVQTILDAQLPDGGWALSGETSDPDMTGMALQALAPYYDPDADIPSNVDKAVQLAITCLSRMQNSDGSFSTGDTATAESIAQVIVALTALGIDPDTDERFIKNDCSALDALLTFYVSGGGFKHLMEGSVNGVATEQAYYALTAYDCFLNNRNRLYDMTDILDLGGGVLAEQLPEEAAAEETAEEPAPEKPGFFQWLLSGIQNLFSWFTK